MKKILKITLVTALAVATIAMTLVTSFAGNVSSDYVDVYSPTYNLRDFNFVASPNPTDNNDYYVNLSNLSLYALDESITTREPTNLTIPPQNGDPAPTFYLSTFTAVDIESSRLFTGVQVKDASFTQTYWTTKTEMSLHFGEMVLNPDLVSGAVNFSGITSPLGDVTSYDISLVYSGECYFPLVNGGFRTVHFGFSGSRGTYFSAFDSDNFRFSLAPSIQHDNNGFQKLTAKDFYQRVYDALNASERDGLVNPSESNFFKAGDPIALRSYSVDASLKLRLGELPNAPYIVPSCQLFTLEFPASINGVVRPDEDFLRAWNKYENRPLDFEDFSFVSWIETIVFGLGSIEFIPGSGFYLLLPIVGSVALALIIWALKIFLGG